MSISVSVIRTILLPFILTFVSTISYSQQSIPSVLNRSFIDSLESNHSTLHGKSRIKQIKKDCRNLGYFHPREIIYIIDKTIPKLQKEGNSQAEIDLLFEKNQIISSALSDLEGSRKLSYKMLDELPLSKEEEGLVLDFIARTHLAKSELVKAEELYERALKLLEEMDDTHTRAHINVYWGVAVTYAESKNFGKSSEYYQKCKDESEFRDLPDMVAACLLNLAANAGEMNDLNQFKRYLIDSEKTIRSIPQENHRVMSQMSLYNAYGDFYRKSGELDSAAISFKRALNMSEKYDDFFTKSYATHSLGYVYLEMNRLEEAEKLLLQSHELFKSKTPSLLLKNSKYLYELYKKKGMYDESLKWHETYTQLNDSVRKAENTEIIADATSKYEATLKDKTIVLLEKEKQIEEQSKERYKNRWQIVIILLLLLLVLGAFYLNHNRHQKRKKKIIHQVLGEERERERISMELHDGICSQITTISRSVRNADQGKETIWRDRLANRLDHLNLEVRDISHNLALLKYDQNTSFHHILEDYIGDLQETVPIHFDLHLSKKNESMFLEPERELVLFRVIQEICNNSIKYSESDTIRLGLTRSENTLQLNIQDYGIGFDPSKTGNGIRNIIERIEFLKGKVQLNTNHSGTSFDIQIPLDPTEAMHE